MADQRSNLFTRIDWISLALFIALVSFGWLSIYAATFQDGQTLDLFGMVSRHSKQFVYIIAALLIGSIILIIDSKFWSVFAYPVYVGFVLLLLFVLVAGREINGAKSWFVLGPIQLQPSEFAKFGTVLVFAKIISRFNFVTQNFKNLFLLGSLMVIPAALILLQPDTGSALVFFSLVLVLFREGLNPTLLIFAVSSILLFLLSLLIPIPTLLIVVSVVAFILAALMHRKPSTFVWATGACALILLLTWVSTIIFSFEWETKVWMLMGLGISFMVFLTYINRKKLRHLYVVLFTWLAAIILVSSVDFIFTKVMEPHQTERISEILGMSSDPLGAGYNLNQSKIAIGSGGFFGKGFLKGTQTRFDFVPEQSTDFIFCTIGEEWGFFGSVLLIGLFGGFLIRIIFLAERQRSTFSRVYIYGVFSVLFFHFMINIGMTIGLVPVIGIPLPFFSYGGSSLWGFSLLVFVMLKLDTDRYQVIA